MFCSLNRFFYIAFLAPTAAALVAGATIYACGGAQSGSGRPAPGASGPATGASAVPGSPNEGDDTSQAEEVVPAAPADGSSLIGAGPGFPESGPWVSFYGPAAKMKDLARVARTYRIINVDADPAVDGEANFSDAQLAVLRAGGKNKVLSYLNLGSCERTRSYWTQAPAPFVPCGKNKKAQLGTYSGYAEETWMDPSDLDYQALMVDFVAARLAARKVDGFYLDNLEIVEHPKSGGNGPCSARCKQGGLDLVRRLREKYPDLLLVMQNATGRVTRLGVTGGVRFATLLDGIAHEEVYAPRHDASAEAELLAWKQLSIRSRSGRPLWIATEDYVGSCGNQRAAHDAWTKSQRNGFSPYISDESGGQNVVCYWSF